MNRYRKRPWMLVLLLVVIFFAGDRLLGSFLRGVVSRSRFRYSRLYAGRAQADVLIIGDSRGVHSFFAPSLEGATGRSVMNLSYNGISTALIESLLADYLEHNPAPKLVIVEVTNLPRDPAALTNFKPFFGDSARIAAIFDRKDRVAARVMTLSHLYRFNCELFLRALYHLKKDDQSWILESQASLEELDATGGKYPDFLSGSESESENLAAMTRIVQMSRKQGFELRLVIAPYWPAYRNRISRWDKSLGAITAVCGGIPIWDYSLAVREPKSFADRVHLNKLGSSTFEKILIKDDFFRPGASPPAQLHEIASSTPH